MQMIRIASLARPLALVVLGVCLEASPAAADPSVNEVLKTYTDIAAAGYADSLATATTLQLAVNQLLANPSDQTMLSARAAWVAARIPYMQTEAFRFGNKIVDDWEGRVNSWPLDEGLIDYVSGSYGTDSPENELYAADVIANTSLTIGGKKLNTSKITKELLADTLQEAGGVEANVATGYHAVEFLLWGQDLNATDLLVDDLAWMAAQWAPGGEARKTIEDGSAEAGLTAILTGLGSLSYGELA